MQGGILIQPYLLALIVAEMTIMPQKTHTFFAGYWNYNFIILFLCPDFKG